MEFIDVRRAFFHAEAIRDVYVELPEEDSEPGMCGKLLKSLYGTRDAAQNWETAYGDFMESIGMSRGKASPCIFYHKVRDLRVVVHGDDFTVLGPEGQLDWFREQIRGRFDVKVRGRMGDGDHDIKSIRILNRVLTWTPTGILYEADQRHAELIMKGMGIKDGDKSVNTPGYSRPAKERRESERELDKHEATQYRGLVARANYLAQDRSDIKFAVKELSRWMSAPRQGDWVGLKRLARYLAGCPRAVSVFKRQRRDKFLVGWSDSDWAGCTTTRKSTSGGILAIGTHVIKTWSSTQDAIALSSGEAEYYALVKCGSQALGLNAMMEDLGISFRVHLKTDASAAQGISARRGLGKIRHIEVSQLWLQNLVHKGRIGIEKIDGKRNLADALTKAAGSDMVELHIRGVGLELSRDRHDLNPQLAG